MDTFTKEMRTSQLAFGGVEVETTVVVDGEPKHYHEIYEDLTVLGAIGQFKKDFYPEYQAALHSNEQAKEVRLQVAYDIIGNLDGLTQTVWIDKAIEKLQQLKIVRENIPF